MEVDNDVVDQLDAAVAYAGPPATPLYHTTGYEAQLLQLHDLLQVHISELSSQEVLQTISLMINALPNNKGMSSSDDAILTSIRARVEKMYTTTVSDSLPDIWSQPIEAHQIVNFAISFALQVSAGLRLLSLSANDVVHRMVEMHLAAVKQLDVDMRRQLEDIMLVLQTNQVLLPEHRAELLHNWTTQGPAVLLSAFYVPLGPGFTQADVMLFQLISQQVGTDFPNVLETASCTMSMVKWIQAIADRFTTMAHAAYSLQQFVRVWLNLASQLKTIPCVFIKTIWAFCFAFVARFLDRRR